MTRRRRYTRLRVLAFAGVGLGLVLSGCGNDRSPDSAVSKSADSGSADLATGGSAGEVAGADVGRQIPPGQPVGVEPSVISTATLRVRVADRRKAGLKAAEIADASGGSVFSQSADLSGDGDTTMRLKVAPDKFDSARRKLADLGTPLSDGQSSQDVTEEVVDLKGRLATAKASAARLRALLSEAPDVQGVVAVEGELTRREAEIESIEGRLRVVNSQVDLATIDLTLTEKGEPAVNKDIPGFGSGLRNGWVAFRNVLAAVVAVVGFLLPFLIVAVPVALVLRWRWQKRPPKPARPVPPGPTPPAGWYGPGGPGYPPQGPTGAPQGAPGAGPAPNAEPTTSGAEAD